MAAATPVLSDRWRADCARCAGLCCSVFAHRVDNGFPEPKPANVPCRHLRSDFRCAVFDDLERRGYLVCRAYDCHGAGPVVTARMKAAGAPLGPAVCQDMTPFFEDFRRLSRLHLLIGAAARLEHREAETLRRALEAVSLAWEEGEVADLDAAIGAAVRPHRMLVAEIVANLEQTVGGKR